MRTSKRSSDSKVDPAIDDDQSKRDLQRELYKKFCTTGTTGNSDLDAFFGLMRKEDKREREVRRHREFGSGVAESTVNLEDGRVTVGKRPAGNKEGE